MSNKTNKEAMRATGYKVGKPSKNSIITKHLMCSDLPRDCRILDFGSGYKAVQAQILSLKYPHIKAYDFPETVTDSIESAPKLSRFFVSNPKGNYDTVIASNVLNVQPSVKSIDKTINELYCNMPVKSSLIANVPREPIKTQRRGDRLTHAQLRTIIESKLSDRFGSHNVKKIETICGKKTNSTLFEAVKNSKEKEDKYCV